MNTHTQPTPTNRQRLFMGTRRHPMVPLSVRIGPAQLRTFQFYADEYDIPLNHLLQSEVYSQASALVDDAFGSLEWMDANPVAADATEVQLEFSPLVHQVLTRVAQLLRRPLCELASNLLSDGATTMISYVSDALEGAGMHHKDMSEWANNAIQFARLAKRNQSPICLGFNCWQRFNIQPPARQHSATASKKGARA